MLEPSKPIEQRRAALDWYIQRRQKKGFNVVSRSDTTAELNKPARFPTFLRREVTIYVEVDERGRLRVRKYQY